MQHLHRIARRIAVFGIALLGLTNTAGAQPAAIAEARYVRVGGIDQWINIRGDSRTNPVLFVVHGGPGAPQSPLISTYASFERRFVVVQWDQRGGGKTLQRAGDSPQPTSLEQLTRDGIELTEYLRTYLKTTNIILLGHSWGSFLGVHIIKRRPELFRAFVGTGQVVSWSSTVAAQYRYTLDRVRADGNSAAVSELEKLGVPASDSLEQYLVMRRWLNRYLAQADIDWISKEQTLVRAALNPAELAAYQRGFQSMAGLAATVFSMDVPALGYDFKLPFFVIQGTDDQIAPMSLAKDYIEKVNAPMKRIITIEGAGHFALVTHTVQFIDALNEDLRLIP